MNIMLTAFCPIVDRSEGVARRFILHKHEPVGHEHEPVGRKKRWMCHAL